MGSLGYSGQGRNEGDSKGATIPRTPNHNGGVENLNNVTTTSFSVVHNCFRKTSGSNIEAPNLLLAPDAN